MDRQTQTDTDKTKQEYVLQKLTVIGQNIYTYRGNQSSGSRQGPLTQTHSICICAHALQYTGANTLYSGTKLTARLSCLMILGNSEQLSQVNHLKLTTIKYTYSPPLCLKNIWISVSRGFSQSTGNKLLLTVNPSIREKDRQRAKSFVSSGSKYTASFKLIPSMLFDGFFLKCV